MRYTGIELRAAEPLLTPRQGPIFTYAESAAKHLLYARGFWGIEQATGLPPVEPKPLDVPVPATGAERDYLISLWSSSWASIWRSYGARWGSIRADAPLLAPTPEPIDWFPSLLPPQR